MLIVGQAMKVICEHRRRRLAPAAPSVRASSVAADVDALLRPKTLDQLSVLERQVEAKLKSNEPIDEEYWESLLESIEVYKAKAQLRDVYKSVLDSRLQALRRQQIEEATELRKKMESVSDGLRKAAPTMTYSKALDPEPALRMAAEDKGLKVVDESEFLARIVSAAVDRKL